MGNFKISLSLQKRDGSSIRARNQSAGHSLASDAALPTAQLLRLSREAQTLCWKQAVDVARNLQEYRSDSERQQIRLRVRRYVAVSDRFYQRRQRRQNAARRSTEGDRRQSLAPRRHRPDRSRRGSNDANRRRLVMRPLRNRFHSCRCLSCMSEATVLTGFTQGLGALVAGDCDSDLRASPRLTSGFVDGTRAANI